MEYAGPDRQGSIRRWHRTHVVANRRVDTAEGTGFSGGAVEIDQQRPDDTPELNDNLP